MKRTQLVAKRSARLRPFFHPRSIAIVGASERGMYPAGLLRNLLDFDFPGQIYPVNLRRDTVFGLPCYADLTSLPEAPDLAIVVVPRRFVLPILRQCIDLNVPAALVISAGFAEADAEGKQLQADMSKLVSDTTLTIVGPNCAGLANIPDKIIATRLTSTPRAGSVSFVSQSGALMMALYGLFADRQVGLSRLLSVGNQVDVTLADGLAYMAQDKDTGVIGAFVEGVQDGRRFATALELALIAGKPVVLVKSGRTEAGQIAASTHTAALAGSDRVFSAVCRQFGVIQADDIDGLIDTIQLMASFGERLAADGRVSVVSQSGGMGSLTADFCYRAGLQLPPVSAALKEELLSLPHMPQIENLGNPSDVRGTAVIGEATTQTLAPFLRDPDTDVVVLLLAKSTLRAGEDVTARAIVKAIQAAQKPLIVVWVGQRTSGESVQKPAVDILVKAGIPVFESPGRAIKAVANAVGYWRFRAGWLADLKDADENG